MSKVEFYKPHIRIKFFADVESTQVASKYPPIVVNRYPDDLEIACTVVRDCLQGNFALTALLDIVNLNTYAKWQLLSKHYRYMIIYVGYLGRDYYNLEESAIDNYLDSRLKIVFKGYVVWMGNIVEARKKVTTRFLAVQNPAESLSANTDSMSIKFSAGYNLYQLINDIVRNANNPNVKLNLSEGDYKEILKTEVEYNNFHRKSIDSILNIYGITIQQGFDMTEGYITESTYIQMNSRSLKPDENLNVTVVTEETGLINIPTLQTTGQYPAIRFKMLFDPRVKTFEYVKLLNGDIQLPSDVNSAEDVPNIANSGYYLDSINVETDELDENGNKKLISTGWGYYCVLKITYSLESRGGNFIQEIEASPYNIYSDYLTSSSNNNSD